jgi:hypothetical protein
MNICAWSKAWRKYCSAPICHSRFGGGSKLSSLFCAETMGAHIHTDRVGNSVVRAAGNEPAVSQRDCGLCTRTRVFLCAAQVDITQLRASLVTTLGEFLQELECASDNISELAAQHVHPRDTVLTYGYSSTVARFLRVSGVIIQRAYPVCRRPPN